MSTDEKKQNVQAGYVPIPLMSLSADQPVPVDIHISLSHKMIKYKHEGDEITTKQFDKLMTHHVDLLYIDVGDKEAYDKWVSQGQDAEADSFKSMLEDPEVAPMVEAVQEHRRAAMDIFTNPKDDETVKKAISTAQTLVTEFLKSPFSLNNISALQKYSKGCADHSVNVSVLSVFLGLRMGYTSQVILENLAVGALFHDFGKVLIDAPGDFNDDNEEALRDHPIVGQRFIQNSKKVDFPKEVEMIVVQHHEFLDGSGYPKNLKGFAVYDLARLVAIANLYDNFVSQGVGETIQERGEEALVRLENEYGDRLDKKKLEKVAKVMRYSFLS